MCSCQLVVESDGAKLRRDWLIENEARQVVWCGVVWCGVPQWHHVLSCGVVWCGVVWCGVVWWPVLPSRLSLCVYE